MNVWIILSIFCFALIGVWWIRKNRKKIRQITVDADLRKCLQEVRDSPERSVRIREEDCPVTDELCAVEQEGELVLYACGHRYASKFAINVFGCVQRPSDGFWDERTHCGDCLTAEFEKHLKRCAHCKRAIMPGDPVALFPVGSRELPEYAVILERVGIQLAMQCTRYSCSVLAGAMFSGNWTMEGFVPVNWMAEPVISAMTGRTVLTTKDGIQVL